jgi:hypothetical protein
VPLGLALALGVLAGLAVPHMAVNRYIKKRGTISPRAFPTPSS